MANANVNMIKGDEGLDVVTVPAAAVCTQGDLVLFGPWLGVALSEAKAIGDELSLNIELGVEVDAVSDAAVAASVGSPIYYNPTTGVFAAAAASGFALAGYATVVKDVNNVFRFEKVRYAAVAA
jgi:predicted RecA/RadA family phage recombinase